jgi:hypothetical protein
VADCPLLRPSRRLAQPGRHEGIGGPARVDPLYSFKYSRYSFPFNKKMDRWSTSNRALSACSAIRDVLAWQAESTQLVRSQTASCDLPC